MLNPRASGPARRSTGSELPQLNSTFRRRPYRAAGPNAALGQALSHRREDRNAIAARGRRAASMIEVMNCNSHNYLLGMPGLKNSDCDIQRYRVKNISQRPAIVLNISYWRGCDPIQGIARRVAKMPGKPMLVIGVQDRTTELTTRYGSTRMNIIGLVRGRGSG
jgi:hypothetical protein